VAQHAAVNCYHTDVRQSSVFHPVACYAFALHAAIYIVIHYLRAVSIPGLFADCFGRCAFNGSTCGLLHLPLKLASCFCWGWSSSIGSTWIVIDLACLVLWRFISFTL